MAAWPVPRQAAQVLMLSVTADAVATAGPAVQSGIGGMLLSGSTAPPGLARALADLHAAGGSVPPLVAVDEEGGRVQRIGGIAPPLASARQQAASLTVAQVEDQAAAVARRLHEAGVDMDFAPDADIDAGSALRPIGDRSFSGEPDTAGRYAVAFARGLRHGGLIPVVKHFPGHGRADGDTEVTSATTPGIDALRGGDLVPFEALIADGVPAIMVGHLTVPGLTEPGRPASLSSAANALLRRDLGFDGLVVTDSLSMGAIARSGLSIAQATVAALRAGADLVVFTSNEDAPGAITAIGASVSSGSLSAARLQDAVTRVLTLKHVDLCAPTRSSR
ncbi:MAG: glycoside hydrolase family 3 N-terminal domain-containing protein [Acidimicrobiales bacterium]